MPVTVRDYDNVGAEEQQQRGIQSAREPRHWAGSEPVSIPGNGEVTITIAPNMDMNPDSLVIPKLYAQNVAVVAANIGPISIAAGDGPFPGDAFTSDSTLRFMPAVPVTSSQPFKVRVRNLTSGTLTGFFLGIVGKVKRAQ